MRISDWSSDVCSSDLLRPPEIDGRDLFVGADRVERAFAQQPALVEHHDMAVELCDEIDVMIDHQHGMFADERLDDVGGLGAFHGAHAGGRLVEKQQRSAEHTSELQSLMRISYAVFCLTKNNKPITTPHTHT